MTEFLWTKDILDKFIEKAMLNDFEQELLKSKIAGESILQQSQRLNVSTSTISRTTARMKKKYDAVQRVCNDLPPRNKLRAVFDK